MTDYSYFIEKPEIRHYDVQNVKLNIEINSQVFPPPKNNPIYSEYMKINRGEYVIDIGTGSGILAILAAKLGGDVFATDVDENAINLAKQNAIRNDVNISFAVGEYFSSYDQKFDVILANLSQTIIPPNNSGDIGILKSVDGGVHGNGQIIELFKRAKCHMHKDSRMYINVFTISDYNKTIEQMHLVYDVKLLAVRSEPVKEFVIANLEWYKSLAESGIIKLFFDSEKKIWMAEQIFYELKLKKN